MRNNNSHLGTPKGSFARSEINSMDSMEALDTLLDRMENTFEWGPDMAATVSRPGSTLVRPTMKPPPPSSAELDVLAELEAFGSGKHPLNAPPSGSRMSGSYAMSGSPGAGGRGSPMGGSMARGPAGSGVGGQRPMSQAIPQQQAPRHAALDTVDSLLAQIDAGLDPSTSGADPLGQVYAQHSDSLFPNSRNRAASNAPQFGRPHTMTMGAGQIPQMMQPQLVQPQLIQPQMVQPQMMQPQLIQPQMVQPQMVQPQMMQPQLVQPQFGGAAPPAAQGGSNVVTVPFPSKIANTYGSDGLSKEEVLQRAARQLKPSDEDDDNLDYVLYQSPTLNFKLTQDEFEMELYNEIATVRKDPKFYAKLLYSTYRPYYQPDGVLRLPGMPGMRTIEGQKACEECIRFLASVEPITTDFKRNMGLCLAAKEAFDELAPIGSTEHPNTVERLVNYGTLDEEAIDMCGFGGEDARQMMVLSWLICDGDADRTRRHMIFNPKWTLIGVAGGSHNSLYRLMGVVVFASGFTADLELMKLTPLFPERVQSEVRPEVAELCDMFKQLQEGTDADEEDDKTYMLRRAAVALSEATQNLVNSNQMSDKDRQEKQVVNAFEELLSVDLMPDEDYLANQAALRRAALQVGTSATDLTRNW